MYLYSIDKESIFVWIVTDELEIQAGWIEELVSIYLAFSKFQLPKLGWFPTMKICSPRVVLALFSLNEIFIFPIGLFYNLFQIILINLIHGYFIF